MDSRTAAHVLSQIATLVELQGGGRFKARAYRGAAKAVLGLDTDDLGPFLRGGRLETVRGLGPASLGVLRDLIETGESRYLDQLREATPEGMIDMLRIPGLGLARIQAVRDGLGIESLEELETAAQDGRLASLPRFGPRTAEKILKGIAVVRESAALELYPQAAIEGARLVAGVRRHPEIVRAEIAGSLRRRREVIGDIDIVAACRSDPSRVAASFARAPGVRDVVGGGRSHVSIRYVDGTRLDLYCVRPEDFAVAFCRATGSQGHLDDLRVRGASRGVTLSGDEVRDAAGSRIEVADEAALYALLGLPWIPPELREGSREVDAASRDALPTLVEYADIRGVLHCHSRYSDGTAGIAELATAAQARGWSYIGISDHSESAAYAGGLSRDAVDAQHEEIDRLNESLGGFRVLKGIEADILADGRIDYDESVLERFDYVIGSIHSRLSMDAAQMTRRVLTALDDPRLTILGHPTGRLLLTREPYAIDIEAVLEKAGDKGVAVELNADPHRLDLDWRLCPAAKESGVAIEIGPDAHSTQALDNVEIGVGIARKGWLEASDILNARPAEEGRGEEHRACARGAAAAALKGVRARLVDCRLPRNDGQTLALTSMKKPKSPSRVPGRRPKKRLAPAKQRAPAIYDRLAAAYPDARCELDYATPLQLLIATILSAQCTDKRVNMVTPALFARYPTASDLADAKPEELEEMIRSTGFFRNKTKSLLGMAAAVAERHGGEVPATMDELVGLPGVGRKTANVVLGNAFHRDEGVVVDTHVARLSERLGLTSQTDPVKIEQELMALFPVERWTMLSHLLIFHGRRICDAKKPKCGACVVNALCPSARVDVV